VKTGRGRPNKWWVDRMENDRKIAAVSKKIGREGG